MALTFRSIDTMKASRDSNSWTNAQKIEHINSIVQNVPNITHITVASYQNNFGYQSVAYIKEWFDAIHSAGKSVFFRPALATFSPNTAAGLTSTCVSTASNFSSCWEDGDAWDVVPESNPLSSLFTDVAGWNQWVRDTVDALDSAFTNLGKDVDHTFFSTTDQTAIFNSRIEADTLTKMGNKICIDFYPMDVGSLRAKIASFMGQIARAHTNYPTADIYVTETGYNNTTLVGDEDQRTLLRHFFNELSTIPYVKGLNYWHGYGNATFDKCLIYQSQSRTLPRPALYMLGEYYSNGQCGGRVQTI